MAEQIVELTPGESRVVSFEAVPKIAKTYRVSVNGLTGSFVAKLDLLTRAAIEAAKYNPPLDAYCPGGPEQNCGRFKDVALSPLIIEAAALLAGTSEETIRDFLARARARAPITYAIYVAAILSGVMQKTLERSSCLGGITGPCYAPPGFLDMALPEPIPTPPPGTVYVEISPPPRFPPQYLPLTVLDIEGIAFASVEPPETEVTEASWRAFGRCVQDYHPNYITDGVGLALCMREKVPFFEEVNETVLNQLGQALKQCGDEHPEYLTDLAKSINVDWPGHTYWESIPHRSFIGACASTKLRIFSGPTATLTKPIAMGRMRGITLKVYVPEIGQTLERSGAWRLGASVGYEPQFNGRPYVESPPAFRGSAQFGSYWCVWSGGKVTVSATSCFGGGYYYPGMYNGIITLNYEWKYPGLPPYGGGGFLQLRIKNLAKVTGTGVISPYG